MKGFTVKTFKKGAAELAQLGVPVTSLVPWL